MKEEDSITIELPIKEEKITISAQGSPEALAFFKERAIYFFKEMGGEKIRHINQKLTEDQVREIKRIRKEKGWGRTRLSRKFKVGKSTIERILDGRSWKDVVV